MELINSKDELIKNIETLEYYIKEGKDLEVIDAKSLIKRGTCFVVYKIDSVLYFAPSRFIGYRDNNLDKHLASEKKDGRDTNQAIIKILETKPEINDKLNEKYLEYCNHLGFQPGEKGSFGAPRKFWYISNHSG